MRPHSINMVKASVACCSSAPVRAVMLSTAHLRVAHNPKRPGLQIGPQITRRELQEIHKAHVQRPGDHSGLLILGADVRCMLKVPVLILIWSMELAEVSDVAVSAAAAGHSVTAEEIWRCSRLDVTCRELLVWKGTLVRSRVLQSFAQRELQPLSLIISCWEGVLPAAMQPLPNSSGNPRERKGSSNSCGRCQVYSQH